MCKLTTNKKTYVQGEAGETMKKFSRGIGVIVITGSLLLGLGELSLTEDPIIGDTD